MKTTIFTSLIALLVFAGCTSPSQLKKTMVDNPDILFEVIEKHPDKFLEVVNKAARSAQEKARGDQEKEEQERLEEEFKNPKVAELAGAHFQGKENAEIVLVEYSDFECPYCARGFDTVQQVKKAYGDKIKFVFKHLPLEFHPQAMPAAKIFEAIAMQDVEKAFKFHDEVFSNQAKLKEPGTKWMESVAKKLGVNIAKMKKDAESDKVKEKIEADVAEARKFGISGTPGFLINGITLKGAYPFPEFKKIIDRHLAGK